MTWVRTHMRSCSPHACAGLYAPFDVRQKTDTLWLTLCVAQVIRERQRMRREATQATSRFAYVCVCVASHRMRVQVCTHLNTSQMPARFGNTSSKTGLCYWLVWFITFIWLPILIIDGAKSSVGLAQWRCYHTPFLSPSNAKRQSTVDVSQTSNVTQNQNFRHRVNINFFY